MNPLRRRAAAPPTPRPTPGPAPTPPARTASADADRPGRGGSSAAPGSRPSPWSDVLGRAGIRSLQVLAVLAVVVVAALAIRNLTLVVIPVLLAIVLAAAIHPLVELFHKVMPGIVATWLALLLIAGVLGGVLSAVVLAVADQWDELSDSAVEGAQQLVDSLDGLPFQITEQQIEDLRGTATDFLTSSAVGTGALAGVSATANFVTGALLMLVVLFFLLKDGPRIWEFLLRPFEGETYARARRAGARTVSTLGGYLRGTAIVAAVDALGIGIGLAVLGIPLALPLAVLVFLLAFIPLVGATLAGVLAALVALVTNGPTAALLVIAIVVAVNQLEGNLLQPVVMARSLALHPLVILIALTVGTVVAGITGAVLAVPIAASAWGVLKVWNGPDAPARPVAPKARPSLEHEVAASRP